MVFESVFLLGLKGGGGFYGFSMVGVVIFMAFWGGIWFLGGGVGFWSGDFYGLLGGKSGFW